MAPTFNASIRDEYVEPKVTVSEEDMEGTSEHVIHEEEKTPLTEKIKIMLSKMFEVEDQSIN